MQAVFNFIFHAFTVLGMLGLGYLLFEGVSTTQHRLEKMIRGISVVTGIFIYGAARSMELSLTEWIAKAIESGTWFTFLTVGTFIPSILGLLAAKYVVHVLKSANYMAVRVILFMGALILLQFCDLYITSGLRAGFGAIKPLAPNLLFLSFFGLYLIFRFKPKGFNRKDLEPAE